MFVIGCCYFTSVSSGSSGSSWVFSSWKKESLYIYESVVSLMFTSVSGGWSRSSSWMLFSWTRRLGLRRVCKYVVYYLLLSPAPVVAHEVVPLQGHGEGVLVGVLLPGDARGVVPLLRGDLLAPGSGAG